MQTHMKKKAQVSKLPQEAINSVKEQTNKTYTTFTIKKLKTDLCYSPAVLDEETVVDVCFTSMEVQPGLFRKIADT